MEKEKIKELYAIVRSYPDQIGDYFCRKCGERIKEDIEFCIHVMNEKGLEFRHYHLKCAPKRKIGLILSILETNKRRDK